MIARNYRHKKERIFLILIAYLNIFNSYSATNLTDAEILNHILFYSPPSHQKYRLEIQS